MSCEVLNYCQRLSPLMSFYRALFLKFTSNAKCVEKELSVYLFQCSKYNRATAHGYIGVG